jgi:hypothetical protein
MFIYGLRCRPEGLLHPQSQILLTAAEVGHRMSLLEYLLGSDDGVGVNANRIL